MAIRRIGTAEGSTYHWLWSPLSLPLLQSDAQTDTMRQRPQPATVLLFIISRKRGRGMFLLCVFLGLLSQVQAIEDGKSSYFIIISCAADG